MDNVTTPSAAGLNQVNTSSLAIVQPRPVQTDLQASALYAMIDVCNVWTVTHWLALRRHHRAATDDVPKPIFTTAPPGCEFRLVTQVTPTDVIKMMRALRQALVV